MHSGVKEKCLWDFHRRKLAMEVNGKYAGTHDPLHNLESADKDVFLSVWMEMTTAFYMPATIAVLNKEQHTKGS